MRTLDDLGMLPPKREAILDLKSRIQGRFGHVRIVLFGSEARGQADEESDLDLLVITPSRLPRTIRHQITDEAFEVNLVHGTNISTTVVDEASWEKGPFSLLSIRRAVQQDGVEL